MAEYFKRFSKHMVEKLTGRHTTDKLPIPEQQLVDSVPVAPIIETPLVSAVPLVSQSAPETTTKQSEMIEAESTSLLFKEVIGQITYPHYIVVSDDVEYQGISTAAHAQTGATQRARENHLQEPEQVSKSYYAQDVTELFQHALSGNNGKPASAVLLDHEYIHDIKKWTPTPDLIQQLASEIVEDVPHMSPTGQENSTLLTHPTLLQNPNSITLSILLRSLGYNGQIFVVSSSPPDVKEISATLRGLKEDHNIDLSFPINGYVHKKPIRRYALYANSIADNHWETEMVEGGLPEAFAAIFNISSTRI